MSCKYEFYDKEETYFPRLYCSIDGKPCIYSKKCNLVEKFIPLDNQGECYKMVLEERKNIPSDSYFVQTSRPNKKGLLYLYVEIDDTIVKLSTQLTEINQNYVYLKKVKDSYEVSLVPFPKEEKKTYARRKKSKPTEE